MGTRPDVSHLFSVKVDNLSRDTREDDLREAFKEFGEIGDIYMPRYHDTMDPRGYAFVRFVHERDAEDAVSNMDGKRVLHNEVYCQLAKYTRRPPPPRRGRGYGGGGGGYGGRRGGHDRYRDDYRRDDRYRDDYRRDDRYRDDYRRDDYRRDDRYRDDYRRDDRYRDDDRYRRDERDRSPPPPPRGGSRERSPPRRRDSRSPPVRERRDTVDDRPVE